MELQAKEMLVYPTWLCVLGAFYEIQCLLWLLRLPKKRLTLITGGLEEYLKNPSSTDPLMP